MKKDYHIHTHISKDSKLNPDELILKAIDCNYAEIAFTDHLEFLFPQWSFHQEYSFVDYLDFFTNLQEKYSSQIKILRGVEIGEYQETKEQVLDYFAGLRPDIILGSVHTILPDKDISLPFAKPLSKQDIISYYKANLKLVEKCQIDVLAHLGIFARYLQHNIKEGLPICKDIFQVMKEKEIALEINYSGLRKVTKQIIPHLEVLELYANEGGELISLGSDSHQVSDFDDNYEKTWAILKDNGFGMFENK
jgi:histidinol-phosphatase (PHP family)